MIQLEEARAHEGEWRGRHREDYYAAQIAEQTYRLRIEFAGFVAALGGVEGPEAKLNFHDFLMTFVAAGDKSAAKPPRDTRTAEQRAKDRAEAAAARLALTKGRWMAAVAYRPPAEVPAGNAT